MSWKSRDWNIPRGLLYPWLPTGLNGKEFNCECGRCGLIPGLGRSLGGGNGQPLQYSYLGNPMDRGDWWAIVHGFAKSWT